MFYEQQNKRHQHPYFEKLVFNQMKNDLILFVQL